MNLSRPFAELIDDLVDELKKKPELTRGVLMELLGHSFVDDELRESLIIAAAQCLGLEPELPQFEVNQFQLFENPTIPFN